LNLETIEPLESLGIRLIECTSDTATFEVPMRGNQNDKGTLFAGSQYSGLVICGWYLVSHWAQEQNIGTKVAIKDCQVSYPNAAYSGVKTVATFSKRPDKRPSGHWRALVQVTATDEEGQITAVMNGDYRVLA
jgi:thioesterase domain-containing protein